MLRADEANRRYFREAYRTGVHGWNPEEPDPHTVAFLERVREQVARGSLLDVGCGEGRHCVAARRIGLRVTGIDREPLALERARAYARACRVADILFRKADVFSLPFPPSCFDVVLDYGCLHHQKKAAWAAYRESILRVLKPTGFFMLSVFSPRFRLFRGASRPWHIAHGAYRRCFTPMEIVRLFKEHFRILEIQEEHGEGRGFWHVLMRRRAAPQNRRQRRMLTA
jgi:SAM-dependent methyltransferase